MVSVMVMVMIRVRDVVNFTNIAAGHNPKSAIPFFRIHKKIFAALLTSSDTSTNTRPLSNVIVLIHLSRSSVVD